MFITWFDEILNVWANDSAKSSNFLFCFSIFLLVYLLLSFKKDIFLMVQGNSAYFRKVSKIIFSFIMLVNLIGLIGIGQLILDSILDSLIRSFGIFCYICGLILYIDLLQDCKKIKNKNDFFNTKFYKITRNPDFTLLIIISFGSSLLALSFFGIILTLFVFLPLTVIYMKNEEKLLLKAFKNYYDYKLDVPLFVPDVIKMIKKAFYRKSQ